MHVFVYFNNSEAYFSYDTYEMDQENQILLTSSEVCI